MNFSWVHIVETQWLQTQKMDFHLSDFLWKRLLTSWKTLWNFPKARHPATWQAGRQRHQSTWFQLRWGADTTAVFFCSFLKRFLQIVSLLFKLAFTFERVTSENLQVTYFYFVTSTCSIVHEHLKYHARAPRKCSFSGPVQVIRSLLLKLDQISSVSEVHCNLCVGALWRRNPC